MYLIDNYITPQELTGYARAALENMPDNQGRLEPFLPNRTVNDLQYRFTRGGGGLTEAATFRSYDAESGIAGRPGLTRVTGELPPISRKIRLGEYDRLRLRANGNDAIVQGIFDDADRMVAAVEARIEKARGDALYGGKITLNENGLIATIDFGRAGGHSTAAGVAWTSASTAHPVKDLLSWVDTYVASNNGYRPGAILMGRKVLATMGLTDEVRALLSVGATVPSIVSQAQVSNMLAAFGLPPITLYDRSVNIGGSTTRVIPENAVILLPAVGDTTQPLGGTLWGVTAESLEPGYNLSGDEPGIVAGSYREDDPVSIWTKAAAISLPVLANPDLSFRATVW